VKEHLRKVIEDLALIIVIAIAVLMAAAFILSVIDDWTLSKIYVCLLFVLFLMSVRSKISKEP